VKGILAYQEPGEEPVYLKGEWCSTNFDTLPLKHFFVTDFAKQNCFYFQEENDFLKDEEIEFFLHKDNSVLASTNESYLSSLSDFQKEMSLKGIQKAIFSRIFLHNKSEGTDLIDLFKKLCLSYKKEAFVYLISDPQFGTWMGATPEVLVKGNPNKLSTVSLAGTKKSSEIEWTPKEVREQAIVSDYIRDKLTSFNLTRLNESEVKTIKNGAVFHLRKDFDFQLSSNKWNELISKLHPTPAVCGLPMKQAYDLILSKEPHQRLFYTGLIGYKTVNKIAVYVNLRCMQILKTHYALYLGGGITKESIPEDEWEETVNKSKTLLEVIES
jgi:isochorismate synthase